MTAFTPDMIPSDISEVEELMVWCGSMLSALYPDKEHQELLGENEKRAICSHFTSAVNQRVVVVRLCVNIDQAYESNRTQKFWKYVFPLGQAEVPANYKVA